MKKKLVGMILTAAMVVTMAAGCGGSGGQTSNETAGSQKEADDTAATQKESGETAAKEETKADSEASTGKTKLSITYVDSSGEGENSYFHKEIAQAYEGWDKKDQVELDIRPIVATESDYFTKVQLQMADESTADYPDDPGRLWNDLCNDRGRPGNGYSDIAGTDVYQGI